MTGRERFLMWVGLGAAGFLVLFVGYAFVWSPLADAWQTRKDALTTLTQTQNDLNTQLKTNAHILKLDPRLALASKLSLPKSNPLYNKLGITLPEAAKESPARLALRKGVDAHVWVGGQERPAFLWQARMLSEAWDCDWTVAPGKSHFDVIDDLQDPGSALMEACLGGF